jgi:hypothetical protein
MRSRDDLHRSRQQPSAAPIRDVGAIPLSRTVGGTPDIPDAHIPDAVGELPDVAHIHRV